MGFGISARLPDNRSSRATQKLPEAASVLATRRANTKQLTSDKAACNAALPDDPLPLKDSCGASFRSRKTLVGCPALQEREGSMAGVKQCWRMHAARPTCSQHAAWKTLHTEPCNHGREGTRVGHVLIGLLR